MDIIYEPGKYTISFIYNHSNYTKYKLIQLLKKFTNITESLFNLLKDSSDHDIITYVKNNPRQYNKQQNKRFKVKRQPDQKTYDQIRAEKRGQTILDFLKNTDHKIKKIDTYLDIGCFDGKNTIVVGQMLGLNKNNIYGVDIESYSGMKIKPVDGFNFQTYDGINLPFPDNKFDLITMLQVLHHVREPHKLLKEIKRICKPNGLVFLREHNKGDQVHSMIFYLEHLFYSVIIDKIPYNDFVDDYYEHYYSKKELKKLFTKYGFVKVKLNIDLAYRENTNLLDYNPTAYYHTMFAKLTSS